MRQKHAFLCIALVGIIALVYLSLQTLPVVVRQTTRDEHLIVIDPGHGGNDPGKVGSGNVLEKEINLSIAKQLAAYLKKKKYQVYLTRDQDCLHGSAGTPTKRDDLRYRKDTILRIQPAACISIHQNSYPSPNVSGAQVFYYQDSLDGKCLADSIQERLKETLDSSNHRMAKANADYYLLRDNPYPTVIVECGFLSNEAEKKLLQSPSYQKKAVRGIYLGLKDWGSTSTP